MLDVIDFDELMGVWCAKHVWNYPESVDYALRDSLPIMLRRITNPIHSITREFYADMDIQPMESLDTVAHIMGYEIHPVFRNYEVEEFTIGTETATKYALGYGEVRQEWIGCKMIAIVPKKDKDGLRVRAITHEDALREYCYSPGYKYVFFFLLEYIRQFAMNRERDLNSRIEELNSRIEELNSVFVG